MTPTATAFLDDVYSNHPAACATETHAAYLAGLKVRLDAVDNPFRGFPVPGLEVEVLGHEVNGSTAVTFTEPRTIILTGLERIRVKHLSDAQRVRYGITDGMNEGGDVYHYNYSPFECLTQAFQTQNVVPMIALVDALSSVLWAGADLHTLLSLVTNCLSPGEKRSATMTTLFERINMHNHIAWGVSRYGQGYRNEVDYKTYLSLHKDIQELDEYTTIPALKWMKARLELELHQVSSLGAAATAGSDLHA